ncbi:MAG: hypothetical protein HUU15_01115 [Candidatus Brocadiae bacterium]|nr:hypothetical protein [Candidatus Brocadiia bacterium]
MTGSGIALAFFGIGGVFFFVFIVKAIRRGIAAVEAQEEAATRKRAQERESEAMAQAVRERHRGPTRQVEDSVAAQAPGANPYGYEALACLTPMQRRFIMAELLGAPVALKDDGESDCAAL